MNYEINETHDPSLVSWLDSANDPRTDFPLQNLPVCRFVHRNTLKIGVAIGDFLLDFEPYFDTFVASGQERKSIELAASHRVRRKIQEDFSANAPQSKINLIKEYFLVPIESCKFVLPFEIGDYTDFYCSIFHASNVGAMLRPDNPLFPNYKWLPIGYHGRASSIVISGTSIKRPKGQSRSDPSKPPQFVPCKNLDYEVEVGFFIGKGNNLGEPIPISEAEQHIFGLCIVNDWSARDIQAWEYQPLGPFLAKSFATTISPFVVTMEALAPFRCEAFRREPTDPQPLEYIYDERDQKRGGIDLNLEVYIRTQKMREKGLEPYLLSRSNMKDLYWTIAQMVAHHTSNGCNLRQGDLLATGTVSGREKHERGCLLELTWRGTEPLELPTGEMRRFLEDGDEIIMKGYCEREGFRRIGFGECRGIILPAD
ncbi:MAG: fumarylacetoacetase [Acidobacteriota bacterium]|nr:fumarylacetoacetase [Pyrinomonadaceae bacterium]MDW8303406.1 fumarylacetoacetase [Acidobacteriota bacterium]